MVSAAAQRQIRPSENDTPSPGLRPGECQPLRCISPAPENAPGIPETIQGRGLAGLLAAVAFPVPTRGVQPNKGICYFRPDPSRRCRGAGANSLLMPSRRTRLLCEVVLGDFGDLGRVGH